VSHVLRLSFLLHYSSQLMHQGSRFYHFILFFWVIGYSIVIEWCYIQRTTLSRNFTKYTFFFFVQHFNRYCVFQLSQNKKMLSFTKTLSTTLFQNNQFQFPIISIDALYFKAISINTLKIQRSRSSLKFSLSKNPFWNFMFQ
jgi:hypothetical protein